MRPAPKKKIDTQGAQTPLAGLGTAFSGVDLPGSPEVLSPAAVPTAAPSPPAPGATTQPTPAALWKLGRVVLRRERAQRGGKTVVVVDAFASHLPLAVIEDVARRLRAACGCGGTVRGRTIEIQGDQPERIHSLLEADGFQVGGVR